MDWLTAGGFLVAYSTSHYALVHRAQLQAGETLLVLGAAGGVGLRAVEGGKQLGARVVAPARGPHRLAGADENGAHEILEYPNQRIPDPGPRPISRLPAR